MAYDYFRYRRNVFTEEGFKMLEAMNKNIKNFNNFSFKEIAHGLSGDSWLMLACIDYLEETGKIMALTKDGWRQNWVYAK